MAIPRASIGTTSCLCCGETIPAKVGEKGALSVSCPWCDLSAYARAGSVAHRKLSERVKLNAASAPEPVPAAPTAPAKGKPSTIFG